MRLNLRFPFIASILCKIATLKKAFVICFTIQTLRLVTKIAKNFVNSSRNRRIFAALWGNDRKASAKSAVGQVNGLRMMQGKPKTVQLCRHGLGANRFWRDEQGSVTIFAVLSTMVMVNLGGLAADMIRFESQRAQLQHLRRDRDGTCPCARGRNAHLAPALGHSERGRQNT
ncbi:MAG: pilus assembly protein TadG-related protein [Proteobacteria bacterium]|nr:pilus assembly protein TadG-related protein [Pseudomonadota bacterium]